MKLTVKRVAEMAGVSVRTLHHYDHIGLLRPTTVTEAGYRIYTRPDLQRLQQILFFRELGFELSKIKEFLDSPDFDQRRALQTHRELLVEKRDRLGRLIATIDESLMHVEMEDVMNQDEMFSGFDRTRIEEQIDRYHGEAVELFGKDTVESSETRVRSLGPDDWQRIERETDDLNRQMAALMDTHSADSTEVQEMMDRWFTMLNQYFSEYTPESFAGLGELYVLDERFSVHYDTIRPGLALFFRDGMRVFANQRQS